jgi:hypothetical protein
MSVPSSTASVHRSLCAAGAINFSLSIGDGEIHAVKICPSSEIVIGSKLIFKF